MIEMVVYGVMLILAIKQAGEVVTEYSELVDNDIIYTADRTSELIDEMLQKRR